LAKSQVELMQEKNKPINKTSTVKAVDGLGNSMRDYIYNPAENKFEHKDDLVHESPLPVGMPRELKFGSAAHRRKYPSQYKTINELEDLKKFQNGTYVEPTVGTASHRKKYPERYGHHYTSKLEQVVYPKLGTAPSEKINMENTSSSGTLNDPYYSKQAIRNDVRKKEFENRRKKLPPYKDFSMSETIVAEDTKDRAKKLLPTYPREASPEMVGEMAKKFEEMRQMTGSDGRYDKPKKKINPYADVKIAIPTIDHSLLRDPNQEARDAVLEKTRAYAFTPRPDPDAVKGIGSFKDTIGKQLRAANSKSDWEKSNQRTYEDNSDEKN